MFYGVDSVKGNKSYFNTLQSWTHSLRSLAEALLEILRILSQGGAAQQS